jgi:hypothetical protein
LFFQFVSAFLSRTWLKASLDLQLELPATVRRDMANVIYFYYRSTLVVLWRRVEMARRGAVIWLTSTSNWRPSLAEHVSDSLLPWLALGLNGTSCSPM